MSTESLELVAPAGNLEKLQYAYTYGADAAYIGLKKFSLRIKADNFYNDEYEEIIKLKKQYPGKRLFCALNISFHNRDIEQFLNNLDYFRAYPIDAFIIQDIGMVPTISKYFPNAALHLSTQANCINKEAVKMYKSLGFKRVVLGREASLDEIKQIKDAVPEMELEVFCHGAMCISYSGRCLMSAYLTGRSANGGFCSHSCRWNFQVNSQKIHELAQSGALSITEQERPGEYFPVFEGDDFTAVLSSKDLCMIDHLDDLKKAGAGSLKIEGRMKSLYYVAMTTRAYRKGIDALEGRISAEEAKPFIQELYKAPHREFGTGFYYRREDADITTSGESSGEYCLVATVISPVSEKETAELLKLGATGEKAFYDELNSMHPEAKLAREKDLALHPEKKPIAFTIPSNDYKLYNCKFLNLIKTGEKLEYIGPDQTSIQDFLYKFVDRKTGFLTSWTSHDHDHLLLTNKPIKNNWIIREKSEPVSSVNSR